MREVVGKKMQDPPPHRSAPSAIAYVKYRKLNKSTAFSKKIVKCLKQVGIEEVDIRSAGASSHLSTMMKTRT